MKFRLPLGTDIADINRLENAYSVNRESTGCLTAILGADRLGGFLSDFTQAISEPIFFFLELPCTDEEERSLNADSDSRRYHYKLYYLDNCTRPVIKAILESYGSLMINDGLCRFGFGGNESGDEIYVQTYNVTSVYCSSNALLKKTTAMLKKQGAEEREKLITPWDIISESNTGTCVRVDEDGISVFDLPELLKDAGMYFAEIV
jgi:hypothetical protein